MKQLSTNKVRSGSPARLLSLLFILFFALTGFVSTVPVAVNAAESGTFTGNINGADYKIEVPANWNGTLVLYSHGYVRPGDKNPATSAPDPVTGAALLSQGYALAGSSYRTTGWAVQQALEDQVALLDYFKGRFGAPGKTIAWGHSLGGMITAGLVQRYPERIDAALPMCGVLGGGINVWNGSLDSAFAMKVLLDSGAALQVTGITSPQQNLALAIQALDAAQATAQGRARIALAAALNDIPGWFNPAAPQPASTDFAAREQNQYLWLKNVDLPFAFAFRADLEARAGGNPNFNTGVDYRDLLNRASNKDLVAALYSQAGLNLESDLNALNAAPRIAANPEATAYLDRFISFNGVIKVPVLTLHTTGDGLVVPNNENSYLRVVKGAGNDELLRQVFVNRAGHCTFTPAETLTAFAVLVNRLQSGQWGPTAPQTMNAAAAALGSNVNVFAVQGQVIPAPPAFTSYLAAPYLRDAQVAAVPAAPAPPVPVLPGAGLTPDLLFPQTGFGISGALLKFWQNNGGLPVFGFPIDSERQENGQVFQWFERNRLELHPENKAPYNVLLGLLGSEALARKGIDWNALPRVSAAPDGCVYFATTGHSLCGDFLNYWQQHGLEFESGGSFSYAESLALFGYPISEPRLEINSSGDTVLSQWFERARFELHPDNPAEYRVLLGRLGAEVKP